MLTVALIEDDDVAAQRLRECLDEFTARTGEAFRVVEFREATGFIEDYKPIYDIVFMDIEMPTMSGMEAARRLRAMDGQVILIFVTNMVQYAAKGYEVDALDYIVKPFGFADFERKLKRAVVLCRVDSAAVVVRHQGGTIRVLVREIEYIEVRGHDLLVHTESGVVRGRGTLHEIHSRFGDQGFLRCSKGFLVNQRHVSAVDAFGVRTTSGEQISIGRTFKKSFMSELAAAMGATHVI